MKFLQVYISTTLSDVEEIETLYEQINTAKITKPAIVVTYFNAKLGMKLRKQNTNSATTDTEEEMILEQHGLYAANTFYKKKENFDVDIDK